MPASRTLEDEDIEVGGDPGQLFFYRPGQVLIRSTDKEFVAQRLGPERPPEDDPDIPPGDDRKQQVLNKRKERGQPFGVMVFHFDHPGNTNGWSVPDALAELKRHPAIEADYNYVTARTPMRSHAVSYAEPADLTDIDPPFVQPKESESDSPQASDEHAPDDGKGDPRKVAVLDTGRPYYSEPFRKYFLNRLEDPEKAKRAKKAPRGPNAATLVPSLDETNPMFGSPESKATPRVLTSSSGDPVEEIGNDRDTMVTTFGRLDHPHAGHGIFVSSIVARHAPGVQIVAEATMSYDAIGDLFDMLLDIHHAMKDGCRLLNMSLGFHTKDNACPQFLEDALKALEDKDGLLVASAGNDGGSRLTWPAAHELVVAVAATDENGRPTDWSNFGDWVDVCAYGNDVVSHYPYADWDFPDGTAKRFRGAARWSGTSFAAPLVTGLIAKEVMSRGKTPREAWKRLLKEETTTTTLDTLPQAIPDDYGPRLGPLPRDDGGAQS